MQRGRNTKAIIRPVGMPPPSIFAECSTHCESRIAEKIRALLGFAILFLSYDYIALFVPFFDIAMSLGNLFHRIAFIYRRF
jgi:hypothetical protein